MTLAVSPFVLVVGLSWSGKAFAAGVLDRLGVPMAEEYFHVRGGDPWGWDGFEDVRSRRRFSLHSEESLEGFEGYVRRRRELAEGGPCGVKFMGLHLVVGGVPEDWRVVLCRRGVREVLEVQVAWRRLEEGGEGWREAVEMTARHAGLIELLPRVDVELDFREDIRGPGRAACVDRLAAVAGVPVTAAAREFAAEVPVESPRHASDGLQRSG